MHPVLLGKGMGAAMLCGGGIYGLLRTSGLPQGAGQGRRPPRHRRAVPRPAYYSDGSPLLESQEYAACIKGSPITPDRQTPARRQRGLCSSKKGRFSGPGTAVSSC